MGLLKIAGSLKTTLVLLLVIAAVSFSGVIVVQNNPAQFYVRVYGNALGKAIIFLGWDDLYNTTFYRLLYVLLGINLAACTFVTSLKRILKGTKGIALFLVHLSVLVVFCGALATYYNKFSRDYRLSAGETVSLPEEGLSIELKDFNISYYPGTDQPKDYCSNVFLLEKGKPDKEAAVRVNRPVKFGGYSIYQSGFEPFAEAQISLRHMGRDLWSGQWKQGEKIDIPGSNGIVLEMMGFYPDGYLDEKGEAHLRSYRQGNPVFLLGVRLKGRLICNKWVEKGENQAGDFFVFDVQVSDVKLYYSTIINVVKDPGIAYVWSGFLMLFSGMSVILFKNYFANIKKEEGCKCLN